MRLPQGEDGFGIAAHRGNFHPVPHDTGVIAQLQQRRILHGGHPLDIKIMKGRTVTCAFAQHDIPAETGLRAFKGQHLEKMPVIMDRHTPFLVMIACQHMLSRRRAKTPTHAVSRHQGIIILLVHHLPLSGSRNRLWKLAMETEQQACAP